MGASGEVESYFQHHEFSIRGWVILGSSSMKKIKTSARGQSYFTQSGQLIRSLDLWIT